MFIFKFLKWVLLSVVIFIMIGCGGGSSGDSQNIEATNYPYAIEDVEGYSADKDPETLVGKIKGQYWIYSRGLLDEVRSRLITDKFSNVTVLGYDNIGSQGLLVSIEDNIDTTINSIELEKNVKYVFQRVHVGLATRGSDEYILPDDGSSFDDEGDNWHLEDIGMPEAWKYHTGKEVKSVVGVVDGGFYTGHEDLKDRYVSDPVNHNKSSSKGKEHGTAVSSIICGVADNNVGVTGINQDCTIFGTTFFDTNYPNYSSSIRVSNNSWGPIHIETSLEKMIEASRLNHQALFQNLQNKKEEERLWIYSAGNIGEDAKTNSGILHIDPTTNKIDKLSNVIVVGAYYNDHILAEFSNYGLTVDIAAPTAFKAAKSGESDYYTESDYGEFEIVNSSFNGTSASAPVVSGVASLIFEIDPSFTAETVKQILIGSATRTVKQRYELGIVLSTKTLDYGIPILNAKAALESAVSLHEGKSLLVSYTFDDPFEPYLRLMITSPSSNYDVKSFKFGQSEDPNNWLEIQTDETNYYTGSVSKINIYGIATLENKESESKIESYFSAVLEPSNVKIIVRYSDGITIANAVVDIEPLSAGELHPYGSGETDSDGKANLYLTQAIYKATVTIPSGEKKMIKFAAPTDGNWEEVIFSFDYQPEPLPIIPTPTDPTPTDPTPTVPAPTVPVPTDPTPVPPSSGTLSGPCITNFTGRTTITSDMILRKIIYDSYTASNLDVYYMKYDVETESRIKRTQIVSSFSNGGIVSSNIMTKYDSYALIDGGIKIPKEEGNTLLFTLDRIENNGDWTMLRQDVQNNICASTSTPTTWSFSKPMYFPSEL